MAWWLWRGPRPGRLLSSRARPAFGLQVHGAGQDGAVVQPVLLIAVSGAGADQLSRGGLRLHRVDRVQPGPLDTVYRVRVGTRRGTPHPQPGNDPGGLFLVGQRGREAVDAWRVERDGEHGQGSGDRELDDARCHHAARGVAEDLKSCERRNGIGARLRLPKLPQDWRALGGQSRGWAIGGRSRGPECGRPVLAEMLKVEWLPDALVEGDPDEQRVVPKLRQIGRRLPQQSDPQRMVNLDADIKRHRVLGQRIGRYRNGLVELSRRCCRDSEPGESIIAALRVCPGHRIRLLPVCVRKGRLADRDGIQRPDVDLVLGLEGDRTGVGLGALEDLYPGRLLGGGRKEHPGGQGGPGPDTKQAQKLDLRRVRDLIEPVAKRLAKVGEKLEQRDARIALVVIGPLRRIERDPLDQLVTQLIKGTVVEDRADQGHDGATSGRRGRSNCPAVGRPGARRQSRSTPGNGPRRASPQRS